MATPTTTIEFRYNKDQTGVPCQLGVDVEDRPVLLGFAGAVGLI